MNKKLEILAPAGDLQTLKIAINNGADAVYVGANKFSARANATNFSLLELKEAVEYAHLFGSKVYLTVNTIIKNQEMPQVLELVKNAVDIGVDAFILQDMGLAMLLKQNFKNIQLHASTQMGIHNMQGAKILEKLGFSRVVLSREATLQDIKDIKANTKLEIEYFVHGALCIGFSGNCYLSSLCNGCSGNRGKCKQLCRLPYVAYKNNSELKKGFLLSPSDQCLADRLDQLVLAGVTSFKIEGRLKKASYVAAAVSAFKTAILGGNASEKLKQLKQVFSRGEFNNGKYLDNQNNGIINTTYNNHSGKPIGVVKSVQKFKDIYKIELTSSHPIVKGDALKFFSNGVEICSMGVGNVEKVGKNTIVFSKQKPIVNSDVHLIVDSVLEQKLVQGQRKLLCEMQLFAYANRPAMLKMTSSDFEVVVTSTDCLENAKSSTLTTESARQSLSKLNDTVFELSNFEMQSDNVFMAKSVLNDLRRQACEKLADAILESRKPNVTYCKNDFAESEICASANYMIVSNAEQITNKNFDYIFSPKNYTLDSVQKAVETAKQNNIKLYLDMPNLARHNDMVVIDKILKQLDKTDFGLVANNLYVFYYKDKFDIVAGTGLNIINKFAKTAYLNLGSKDIIYSIEANATDLDSNAVVFSKGHNVLMTLTFCPFKMLTNCQCSGCGFFEGLTFKAQDGGVFAIRRKIIGECYFELVDCRYVDNKNHHKNRVLYDARQVLKIPTKTIVGMIDKNV